MKRALGPALVVVLVLGLAGCSGGSNPAPVALPTLSTATPTAGGTARPTIRDDVPVAARAHDAFGAAAFARFYYEQVDRAFASADPAPLLGLADPECGTCKAFEDSARKLAADGERIEGTSVRVVFAEAPPEQNGRIGVSMKLDAPARQVVPTSGNPKKSLPATPRYSVTLVLRWNGRGWSAHQVTDG